MSIVDKDMGFKGAMDRLIAADGISGRAGILSGKPAYPDGTAVAKVAGILQAGWAVFTFHMDAKSAERSTEIARARDQILAGMDPVDAAEIIAKKWKGEIIAQIDRHDLIDTRLMRDTVAYAVTGGGRGRSRRG